jgi:hypothetical protein
VLKASNPGCAGRLDGGHLEVFDAKREHEVKRHILRDKSLGEEDVCPGCERSKSRDELHRRQRSDDGIRDFTFEPNT